MSKKLDSKPLDRQTEKKDLVSQCCACQKSIDDQNAVYFSNRNWICDKCINIVCSEWFEDYLEWKEEKRAFGSEKELPNRENGLNHSYGINGEPTAHHSKLPESIREKGGDVLFYDPCCTCKFEPADNQDLCSKNCFVKTDGHRSAWEPKEKPKTEPEKIECSELEMARLTKDEKLPEPICPFCGRKLIRYKQAWICGHGCTKPALKPTEPELINTSEPLYPKIVYQLGADSKEYVELKEKYDKLIEGFIKFIDHFEGRYEGNICGECLEYWKTIKEHYKGV